jgi:hypothetical protein
MRDRLRKLEDRFRDQGPSLEEVGAAFQRLAESAKAKLYSKSVVAHQRSQDRDTVERWQRAEGTDLSVEAERAREKLRGVDRAQP